MSFGSPAAQGGHDDSGPSLPSTQPGMGSESEQRHWGAGDETDETNGDDIAVETPEGRKSALTKPDSVDDSTWVAESLSLPREILFVAIIDMAQFCTRKSYSSHLFQASICHDIVIRIIR